MNKVVEDILRKGEERRRETISQGEKERDEQVLLANKKIEENRTKAEKRSEASIAQLDQQEISSAELEMQRMLLSAQRKVMEELREQVLSELARYPVDKRKRMYAKLAMKAKKELGECYIYSNKDDKALLQLPPGVTIGGVLECIGGLVFESEDRSVRLDFRFESMLDEVWSKKMKEIHSKLFG